MAFCCRYDGDTESTETRVTPSVKIQSNLGSRKPRIMNNSVYEQIFRTQSVSDDVLCLELRTRKPSTSWSNTLEVSASAEDHKDELSTEELEQLQKQLQKATVEEMSSEEEEGREDVPTSLIREICAK